MARPGRQRRNARGASAEERTAARSRRRFARRQWRRRWLVWKRLAVLAVLVALLTGGTYALYFSTWLSVRGVEVAGARTVSDEVITGAAAVPRGGALARVDLAAIQARVESLGPVREAKVSRQWPDRVRVEVEERVAVAVVDLGGSLRGLDETGVVFGAFREAPADLPRVETQVGTRAEALREAAAVVASLPAGLAGTVDHVAVETVDRISLALRDGRTVVWGSAVDSRTKAAVLAVLLPQEARVYDVSVPGQPTTTP